jgi:hypothetical protein
MVTYIIDILVTTKWGFWQRQRFWGQFQKCPKTAFAFFNFARVFIAPFQLFEKSQKIVVTCRPFSVTPLSTNFRKNVTGRFWPVLGLLTPFYPPKVGEYV